MVLPQTASERLNQSVELFTRAVAETPAVWRAIDVRLVAVRVKDEWHNVLTRCRLDPRDSKEIPALEGLPNGNLVRCWRIVLPIAELPALLQSFVTGHLDIGSDAVLYH